MTTAKSQAYESSDFVFIEKVLEQLEAAVPVQVPVLWLIKVNVPMILFI